MMDIEGFEARVDALSKIICCPEGCRAEKSNAADAGKYIVAMPCSAYCLRDLARQGLLKTEPMLREECAKIAENSSRAGVPLCPYGRDKKGDVTWNHTDEDICPVCKKNGHESLAFCTDSIGGQIASAIRKAP